MTAPDSNLSVVKYGYQAVEPLAVLADPDLLSQATAAAVRDARAAAEAEGLLDLKLEQVTTEQGCIWRGKPTALAWALDGWRFERDTYSDNPPAAPVADSTLIRVLHRGRMPATDGWT